ncbi:hypothetical protein PCASD_13849 [Puccinia coronata f. sp. avenae]|uniref:Uncharacterized protein n=1 Tax=Puccinia coronata f. sp. avenae TaxID=200324 RepID=A0A2N5T336_9BASI|nr:hypothetical protein PCASD_13849 [Puccinia coronata f. sp. avenae]
MLKSGTVHGDHEGGDPPQNQQESTLLEHDATVCYGPTCVNPFREFRGSRPSARAKFPPSSPEPNPHVLIFIRSSTAIIWPFNSRHLGDLEFLRCLSMSFYTAPNRLQSSQPSVRATRIPSVPHYYPIAHEKTNAAVSTGGCKAILF